MHFIFAITKIFGVFSCVCVCVGGGGGGNTKHIVFVQKVYGLSTDNIDVFNNSLFQFTHHYCYSRLNGIYITIKIV